MKKKYPLLIFLSMCLNNLVVFFLCSAIVYGVSLAQFIPLDRQPGICVISQTDGHAIHSYFDTCPESPDGKKIETIYRKKPMPAGPHQNTVNANEIIRPVCIYIGCALQNSMS